jgi:hypothetical protein
MNKVKALARLLVTAVATSIAATIPAFAADLTDEEVDNIVRRSYQYVAMYNVVNKHAALFGPQTRRITTCVSGIRNRPLMAVMYGA